MLPSARSRRTSTPRTRRGNDSTALLADVKTYATGGPQSKNATKALQESERKIAQLEADWERLTEGLDSVL